MKHGLLLLGALVLAGGVWMLIARAPSPPLPARSIHPDRLGTASEAPLGPGRVRAVHGDPDRTERVEALPDDPLEAPGSGAAVELAPRSGGRSRLVLLVVDEGGSPVAQAHCWMRGSAEEAMGRTDERGTCELLIVQEELWGPYLSVEAAGFAPHWSPLQLREDDSFARTVVLERGRELVVTVLEGLDAPVRDAMVSVSWERVGSTDPIWDAWRARTPASGTVFLHGIPRRAGTLQLQAQAPGLARQDRSLRLEDGAPIPPQTLVLEPTAELVLWIEDADGVRHDGRVEVRVAQAPRPMVDVRAEEGGRARGLAAGAGIDLVAYVSGAGLVRDTVILEAGETRELVLPVPRLVPLRVDVLDAEGEPARGRVVLRATDGRPAIAWAPPGSEPARSPRTFQAAMSDTPPTALWVEPGSYLLSVFDAANRRVEQRDLAVHAGGEVEIQLAPARPAKPQ